VPRPASQPLRPRELSLSLPAIDLLNTRREERGDSKTRRSCMLDAGATPPWRLDWLTSFPPCSGTASLPCRARFKRYASSSIKNTYLLMRRTYISNIEHLCHGHRHKPSTSILQDNSNADPERHVTDPSRDAIESTDLHAVVRLIA
jgi:hypothetical protein